MLHIRIVSCLLIGGFALGHIPVPQPRFRSVPDSFKYFENDTICLPCIVDNLGENVLRWWKGDTLLVDTSDSTLISPPRYKMVYNRSLQIDDLKPGDSGEYTCEIIRPDPWSPLTLVHKLLVLYPPKVSPVPEDGKLEVKLGDEVQIGCRAEGEPAPVVKWRTKGETVQLPDNRHLLTFIADNRLKSGLYQCEASNGIGSPAYANIELSILYKPEITVDRSWVHSAPGERAELICRINSNPEAEIVWLFQKDPLEFSSSRIVYRIDGHSHILTVRSTRPSDFGVYTCRASNMLGDTDGVIELSGAANPATFKKDRGHLSPDSYTLIWTVDSYSPIIEYNLLFREFEENGDSRDWIKFIIPADGHSPGPLHSKSYTLTGLKQATVYQAMVVSRNKYGWSHPSSIIKFATEGAGNSTNEIEEEVIEPDEEDEKNFSILTNVLPRRENGSCKFENSVVLTGMMAAVMIILNSF